MPLTRAVLAVLLAGATACGGGSAKPDASATSSTPSPTPTLPPVATDTASVKAAIVTAADIGAPWVVPKTVNKTAVKKGELCPGTPNEQTRVPPRATASVRMTEGTKTGAAIASFDVHAFDPEVYGPYRAAFAAATKDCAAYTSLEKLYVTTEDTAAPVVEGADEVLARIERIYADSSKKQLHYVRQTLKIRVGRAVVAIEHAFVQPATDPTGGDWTKTVALVTKQVAKTRTAFAQ